MRWVTRVNAGSEISTEVVVSDITRIDLNGEEVVFAGVVNYSQSGADGGSLPGTSTYTTHADTLRINEAIDPSWFTLAMPEGFELYDYDEVLGNDLPKSVAQAGTAGGGTGTTSGTAVNWLVLTNLFVLVILIALYVRKARQHRSPH